MAADYHYTRDGHGIIDAVCQMFAHGTFLLGEGDALKPVQEAYLKYMECHRDPLGVVGQESANDGG